MNLKNKYSCYIFPSNVEQIEYFIGENVMTFSCKKIELKSTLPELRFKLAEILSTDNFRLDLLDDNKIIVITEDYAKLSKFSDYNVKDKEIINEFKNRLLSITIPYILKLSQNLTHTNSTNIKKRKEDASLLEKLKYIMSQNGYDMFH